MQAHATLTLSEKAELYLLQKKNLKLLKKLQHAKEDGLDGIVANAVIRIQMSLIRASIVIIEDAENNGYRSVRYQICSLFTSNCLR